MKLSVIILEFQFNHFSLMESTNNVKYNEKS